MKVSYHTPDLIFTPKITVYFYITWNNFFLIANTWSIFTFNLFTFLYQRKLIETISKVSMAVCAFVCQCRENVIYRFKLPNHDVVLKRALLANERRSFEISTFSWPISIQTREVANFYPEGHLKMLGAKRLNHIEVEDWMLYSEQYWKKYMLCCLFKILDSVSTWIHIQAFYSHWLVFDIFVDKNLLSIRIFYPWK